MSMHIRDAQISGPSPIGGSPTTALKFPVQSVAAAGTVIGDAALLAFGINIVTGPDDTKGVRLPVPTGGEIVIIKVGDGADLKVWPNAGAVINALSASAAITVVDDTCFALVALGPLLWATLPLLPS